MAKKPKKPSKKKVPKQPELNVSAKPPEVLHDHIGTPEPINPPEHDHDHHGVTHRALNTMVREYVLNHLDHHQGCQINECEMAVSLLLQEDFGCCKEAMKVLQESLCCQLPLLHSLRGGSSV